MPTIYDIILFLLFLYLFFKLKQVIERFNTFRDWVITALERCQCPQDPNDPPPPPLEFP